MMGTLPMGEFVATYRTTHSRPVAANDVKTAAAIAAATAKQYGWTLLSVQTKEQFEQEKQ
jgi:hypothetical protein